jgi:hypothetical protein
MWAQSNKQKYRKYAGGCETEWGMGGYMEYLQNCCGKTLGKRTFVEDNIVIHLREILRM